MTVSRPPALHIDTGKANFVTEGVMSGIISAKPFNSVFTATDGNSTMQGTVTALYEIGM